MCTLSSNFRTFTVGILHGGYKFAYDKHTTWESIQSSKDNVKHCAQNFLCCIPLIFSGLSYLYWQSNSKGGNSWNNQAVSGSDPLGIYISSMGYQSTEINNKMTGIGLQNLLDGGNFLGPFAELSSLDIGEGYCRYVNNLITTKTSPPTCPLTCLYITANAYYQRYHQNGDAMEGQPRTIREMLYWLIGLPYSSMFPRAKDAIEAGISKYNDKKDASDHNRVVFIKGSANSVTKDIVLDNNSTSYPALLLTPCQYACFVLLAIEGNLHGNIKESTNRRKASSNLIFHKIYCNTEFGFHYPDNINSRFSMLWDVVACVYDQLYFVQRQCQICLLMGCGWTWCQCGANIGCKNMISWICEGNPGIEHGENPDKCNNCKEEHSTCGQVKPSPLQANLCDSLRDFRCEKMGSDYPPFKDHYQHPSRTQQCHIPMGFLQTYLPSSARRGHHLSCTLKYYTNEESINDAILYNLILCSICVGLRTPRTAGDLFGFFYYMGCNMKISAKTVANAIKGTIAEGPFHYDKSEELTDAAHFLSGKSGDHDGTTPHEPKDKPTLRSLSYGECKNSGRSKTYTCGPYLATLSCGIYSNISKDFAGAYLSRMIYLTEELKYGLQALLETFNSIDCKKYGGCRHNKSGLSCTSNCHSNNKCFCKNIVECAGVLGLLYRFGFTYNYATRLTGKYKKLSEYKRECSDFTKQLYNVIEGALFINLLSAINDFLCNIRQHFITYLLTLWLVTMLYLTYGMIIPLDILRIRSHWPLAGTHMLLPILLLSHKISPSGTGYLKP
ncbi:uncharacterized protein BXIN_0930 [Babesia sp. Xinjiang]|uniref:uncharacterized protein n=1 Tax=Babesia sp. Xinjiang TaxID=462227 RepID=UPI000A230FE0|nr:uncharacterized protein BXIN_0930 [Babesia sp. Xinjiang]ORM42064.1 hypothetical protein BXIN_0930 [Babesia sp. Xinjiang]